MKNLVSRRDDDGKYKEAMTLRKRARELAGLARQVGPQYVYEKSRVGTRKPTVLQCILLSIIIICIAKWGENRTKKNGSESGRLVALRPIESRSLSYRQVFTWIRAHIARSLPL